MPGHPMYTLVRAIPKKRPERMERQSDLSLKVVPNISLLVKVNDMMWEPVGHETWWVNNDTELYEEFMVEVLATPVSS